MNETELLDLVKAYFKEKIFEQHKKTALSKHTKLSSYKINPILVRYLSKVLTNDFTPLGVAKALYFPRILSTSITTSFGTNIQKMFVDLDLADGSLIKGMDIEFKDKVDNRKKYCQLKSGPNTINSEDVSPILKKFNTITNLARTNSMNLNNSDLILGILYGEEKELSQHYQKIDETYPVIIGQDFWHRITSFPNFYNQLVLGLDELILNMDTENFFNKGYEKLAAEVEESNIFDFS